MPMPLVCETFFLGWVLNRFTKHKRIGRFFTYASLFFFLLFGYGFGQTYLYNLERRYTPFEPTVEQCHALRGAHVVVLGQGMPLQSDLPIRYQNNSVFDRRLFEGIRVAKMVPESRLIVSMGGEASSSVKQAFLDEYMALINFPTNRVTMFTIARDTTEEAKFAKKVISDQCSVLRDTNGISQHVTNLPTNALANFRTLELPGRCSFSEGGSNFRTGYILLVTSASHIPRAIKVFQKQGMNPIAVPCDYIELEPPHLEWYWYRLPFPSGESIEKSTVAAHEWLGAVFEKFKGM